MTKTEEPTQFKSNNIDLISLNLTNLIWSKIPINNKIEFFGKNRKNHKTVRNKIIRKIQKTKALKNIAVKKMRQKAKNIFDSYKKLTLETIKQQNISNNLNETDKLYFTCKEKNIEANLREKTTCLTNYESLTFKQYCITYFERQFMKTERTVVVNIAMLSKLVKHDCVKDN